MTQKYQKGEYVRFGINGVCLIEDIREMEVGKVKNRFYILRPIRDRNSTFYIPVDNEHLTNKIQKLLDRDEIESIIDAARTDKYEWIEDRKERMEYFRSLLHGPNTKDVLHLAGLLRQKKTELNSEGKKLSPSDENILKQAQELTENEFGFVLEMDAKKIGPYIRERLER